MAPRRRIIREQQEILVNALEENKQMLNPRAGAATNPSMQKIWTSLSERLNAVEGGVNKSVVDWKRYWVEWRHKCRRKAMNARRYKSDSKSRFTPLTDLEIKFLELSGTLPLTPGIEKSPVSDVKMEGKEGMSSEDTDSEQTLAAVQSTSKKFKKRPETSISEVKDKIILPPKWALDLEERRISAEERVATALESMAATMKAQEERRSQLDERITDALTALAGTVQDMNSGVHEVIHMLRQSQTINTDGPDIKDNIFTS